MKTLGIDLGTTNSVVALEGDVIRSPAPRSASTLPSVVAFLPNGSERVGHSARARRAMDPLNTVFAAKRLMGQRWRAQQTQVFREQYAFDLYDREGWPAFETRAGALWPSEIAERVLGALLSERDLDPRQYRAVITVPAAFTQSAIDATRRAAEALGFAQVECADEPLAAAAAHAFRKSEPLGCTVVYDLGGGTLDLAVLDCRSGQARVLCSGGDPYLGGDDVDTALAAWVADQVVERYGWDLRQDAVTMDRLRGACERAKVDLCRGQTVELDIGQIDEAAPPQVRDVEVDPERLNQLAFGLVRRTFLVCDEVLGEAGVTARDVDTVLLAGGGTYMPSIREGVEAYFGRTPRCDFPPSEVVAIGASLMGPR